MNFLQQLAHHVVRVIVATRTKQLQRQLLEEDLPRAEGLPYAIEPLWAVGGKGRAWLDFANDVTTKDVKLAAQEGYTSVEHMKRYTTQGMAPDQGKNSNISALAVLAAFAPDEADIETAGAIILAADASRIARANVHLVPDPTAPTSETGTRHRTAERVAVCLEDPSAVALVTVPALQHVRGKSRQGQDEHRIQHKQDQVEAQTRPFARRHKADPGHR